MWQANKVAYRGNDAFIRAYKGDELVWKKSRLPIGYQEVEYLESSGQQYINTNFIPSNNTTVNLKVSISDYTQNVHIFGCKGTGNNRFSLVYNYNDNKYFYLTLGSAGINNITIPRVVLINTIHDITAGKIDSYLALKVDTESVTKSMMVIDPGTSMIMFAGEWNGSIMSYSKCKIYNFKIEDNGIVYRNFVPARRISDNTLGMYDLVSNTFFTNKGTGTFIAGPDVN